MQTFLQYISEFTDNRYTPDMSRSNAERQNRSDQFNDRENMRQAAAVPGTLGMLHRRRANLQKQLTRLDKQIYDMSKREQGAQQQNQVQAPPQAGAGATPGAQGGMGL